MLAPLLLSAALASAAPPAHPAAASVSEVDAPTYTLPPAAADCAVVVGVERYDRAPWAQFAEHDARAVRAHLLALGYPDASVLLITGKDAAGAGLGRALDSWLPSRAASGSTVFFYFAGDGALDPMTGEQYLLPPDGDPGHLDETALSLARLYARLSRLKARRVVVALDAGFSGEGPRSVAAPAPKRAVTGAAAIGVPARLAALTAAGLEQTAGLAPEQGHGLFTYYLLKALNDRGGRADLRDLRDAAAQGVSGDAALQKREQAPQLWAVDSEDLGLR